MGSEIRSGLVVSFLMATIMSGTEQQRLKYICESKRGKMGRVKRTERIKVY